MPQSETLCKRSWKDSPEQSSQCLCSRDVQKCHKAMENSSNNYTLVMGEFTYRCGFLLQSFFLQAKLPYNPISISTFHSVLIDYKRHKKEEQMPRTVPSTMQALNLYLLNQ